MELEMDDIEANNYMKEDPESSAVFRKAHHPVTLLFVDIIYKVKTHKSSGFLKKTIKSEEKIILKGVTGIVYPGEMLVMLGPSGSAKTTLLTALGGRLRGKLEGTITYNSKPFSNHMKRNTGFVTQDDILLPHLTVAETLIFTALLRLPNSLSKEDKITNAEAVINKLGLNKCKNNIIGGESLRGVSGGERKRVSIGQEILMNPSLLLLDEPTSGLDSTTAQRIVSTLWDLANGGRTIVMTIHQPSSRLFYMFHKVLLLSDGNPLYFGKGSEVVAYFSSIGYSSSFAMNPSDFLLDLANGVLAQEGSHDNQDMVKEALVSSYKYNIYGNLKSQVEEIISHQFEEEEEEKEFEQWTTSWWQQFIVLLRRGVKESRYETFSALKIAQVLFTSLVVGLLWWQSSVSHLQDQIGFLYFSIGFWGYFALFRAIFTFPDEREILKKERSSGMYRLSSYFMSKAIADLPMELVLPTGYVIMTYFMGGLKLNSSNFFYTLFTILFHVLVSQGFGLAVGAVIMDTKSATTLGSVIMLIFRLAGGYYVQHVPSFIAWIKYISTTHYTYKLLLGSQYRYYDKYPCENGDGFCNIGEFPGIKEVGLGGQVIAAVALGIMLVGYRLIAYLALVRIGEIRKLE